MGSLPRFSWDSECPKCRSRNASAFWLRANPHGANPAEWPRDEHIQRACRACGYRWFEAPLDAEPAVNYAEESDRRLGLTPWHYGREESKT